LLLLQPLSLMGQHISLEKIGRCPHFPPTGRPAGDETFATRLEELLGRTLRPKAIGKPRK